MALRLWLPLNGDISNKGISQTTMSGVPASWGTSGKIGKCAVFNGNASSYKIYNNETTYNYVNNFSWAIWVNTDYKDNVGAQFIFTSGRADAGGRGFGIQCSTSTSCLIFFGTAIYNIDVTSGEWTHLVFVKNNTNIKIYKNGSLVLNTEFTGTLPTYSDGKGIGIGCFHYDSGDIYAYYGSINDFRIYDHCLSAKEVKELSKGLILHYPLNNQYNTTIKNKYSGDYAAGMLSSQSFTKTKLENERGWNYKITYTGTGVNNWVSGKVPNFSFTAGKKYFYSVKVRCNKCTAGSELYLRASRSDNDWVTNTIKVCSSSLADSKWHEYYVYQTINESYVRSGSTVTCNPVLEFYSSNLDREGTVYDFDFDLKDIQVVESDVYIPFIENNYTSTVIKDNSGFGYDGTILGTLLSDPDSKRYDLAIKSPNGTDYIKSSLSLTNVTDFTCSFWIKPNSSNGGYSSVACNFNNPSGGFWISTNCEGHSLWFYNGGYADTQANTSLTNGTWYHCALVCKNKVFQWYLNGVKQTMNRLTSSGKQVNISNLSIFNSYSGTSWNTKEYGSISDFRFYATALSEDDILDLYHTSANVDNLQNIHTEALNESSNLSDILKSGTITSSSFYETNGYLISNVLNGGYTPKADTNNSCLDMGVVDFSDYVDLNRDLQMHIECDLEWTAFMAGTGGSFTGFWWQGAQFKRSSSSWVWTEGNPVTDALNNAFNPRNATTVSTAGRHHYDIVAIISASFQKNVSKLYYGFRCDYSNGTGKIAVKNFKATPYQYCNARIGKEFISANSFIEK